MTHQLIQHLHCASSVLLGSLFLFQNLVSVATALLFLSHWPRQPDLCFHRHLYACMRTVCADMPIAPCCIVPGLQHIQLVALPGHTYTPMSTVPWFTCKANALKCYMRLIY